MIWWHYRPQKCKQISNFLKFKPTAFIFKIMHGYRQILIYRIFKNIFFPFWLKTKRKKCAHSVVSKWKETPKNWNISINSVFTRLIRFILPVWIIIIQFLQKWSFVLHTFHSSANLCVNPWKNHKKCQNLRLSILSVMGVPE